MVITIKYISKCLSVQFDLDPNLILGSPISHTLTLFIPANDMGVSAPGTLGMAVSSDAGSLGCTVRSE